MPAATRPGGAPVARPSTPEGFRAPRVASHAGDMQPGAVHAGTSFVPRGEPEAPLPTGAQAVTDSATHTTVSPAAPASRRADIAAHEAVHREQHAARGRLPEGSVPQLEAEARRGSQARRRGRDVPLRHAAPEGAALTYDHASAGGWLDDFAFFLTETTNYDVAGIDWPTELDAMLESERIVHSEEAITALELSDRLRYQFLLEIFAQELEGVELEPPAPGPAGGGLVAPTTEDLEDALFDEYLPLLSAEEFAQEDVADVGDAFLDHWLGELETIRLIPETFDLSAFLPPPRTADVEREREAAFEEFMATEVPDLMFMFVLDEFARAVGGPHADVAGAPLIVGGGELRQLSPERWLETLDMDEYRTRLVGHLGDTFEQRLRTDAGFRRVLLTAADEASRYTSLVAVHGAIRSQQRSIDDAVSHLRESPLDELEEFDWTVVGDPATVHGRMTEVQTATTAFYGAIAPGLDNDAALLGAVDALVDALDRPGDYQVFGAILRLVTLAGSYRTLLDNQLEAARARIDEVVDVGYDDVAAVIAEMATFAAEYLRDTWIPALHAAALRRISANRDYLQDLKDRWSEHTATLVANLDAGALIFEDTADLLEEGVYESVTIDTGGLGAPSPMLPGAGDGGGALTAGPVGAYGPETVTVDDAYRLRDAATIMRAQSAALSDPEQNSERYDKVVEALEGFEDVRRRIEAGEVDPNLYGREVMNDAKAELGLDNFAEYTTYADVIFGRAIASRNPFLSRLVVAWKVVEQIDDALRNITIFVGLGLLTIASLLVGSLGTVAFWVTFAIDASLSIGLGVYQVTEAEALLELVRLDLDQSVTGLTVEQAENALFWAWVMLALSIVLVVGGTAFGLYLRYGTTAGESVAISLRYYRLAVENPTLFSSLRAIVRDPLRLGRMLDLAGDALELERLLHRMDATLDLARVERLVELTSDASRVNRMLDLGRDARAVESALEQLHTVLPDGRVRLWLLDHAADDVVPLVDVLGHTGTEVDDLVRLRRVLDHVPADRLLPLVRTRPLEQIDDLLTRGVRLADLESGIGVVGGGARPSVLDPRAPVPPQVQTLLDGLSIGDRAHLTSATAHEARRLQGVLTNNKFPKKAGPDVGPEVARWAADGADGPTEFVNRWEYARQRYQAIELGLDDAAVPAGTSPRRVAADMLVAEIRGGGLTTRLTAETGRVRAIAGSGWTPVTGTTADEIAASVRARADQVTFGTETTTAYHVHKHGGELALAERPAAGAGFDAELGAYLGSARRTVAAGDVAAEEFTGGVGNLVFTRLVEDADGVRRVMTARVFVRDGHALVTTYGGAVVP